MSVAQSSPSGTVNRMNAGFGAQSVGPVSTTYDIAVLTLAVIHPTVPVREKTGNPMAAQRPDCELRMFTP